MSQTKVDYHKYMASREWALKKEEVKARAGGICERCHNAKIQSTHHLTYERIGAEKVNTDLLGVCNPCHEFLSAKREDDPAVETVLGLIEKYGLQPTLMEPGGWSRLLNWDAGPTSQGHYFHGQLLPDATPRRFFGDYMDDARLIVRVDDGVWFHCSFY